MFYIVSFKFVFRIPADIQSLLTHDATNLFHVLALIKFTYGNR